MFLESSYLCYFDPSPQLPSSLLKNYLVKLNKLKPDFEGIIKILSIRDKLSKLMDNVTLTNTFYLEVKFNKDPQELKIKH